MKNKLLVVALLAGVVWSGLVYARPSQGGKDVTVYLQESFESAVPPTGWTTEVVSGSYDWEQNAGTLHPSGNAAYDGTYVAVYKSYYADEGSNARLITPEIDLTGTTSPKLSFYMFHDPGYSEKDDSLVVEIQVNSGSGYGDWIRLDKYLRYSSSGEQWVEHTIDLSEYAGNYIKLAFHAYSDYGNDIHIDYVKVYEVTGPDTRVTSVDNIDSEPFAVGDQDVWTVNVSNEGTGDASNVPVKMWVEGEGVVDEVTISSIPAGQTATAQLHWTPGSGGAKAVKFFTDLTDDANHANDTLNYGKVAVFSVTDIPLSEGFESKSVSDWVAIDADNDGKTWAQSNAMAHSGSYSIRTPEDGGNYPDNSQDYLYSPMINFGDYSVGRFSFYYFDSLEICCNYAYDFVNAYILSYQNLDSPPDTVVLDTFSGYAEDWNLVKYSKELPGSLNVFVLKFTSDGSTHYPGFFMDDFEAKVIHDVGVSSLNIIRTPPHVVNEPDTFEVWVKNYGSFTENNITVRFWATDANNSVTIPSLAPLDSVSVSFEYTPTSAGAKTLLFFTDYSSDEDNSDDTLRTTAVVLGTQNPPLKESFESYNPPQGWAIWDVDGDGHTWNRVSGGYSGDYSMKTPEAGKGNYPPNSHDRLYTSFVDLGEHPNAYVDYFITDSLAYGDTIYLYAFSYGNFDDTQPIVKLVNVFTYEDSPWREIRDTVMGLKEFNTFVWIFKSNSSTEKFGALIDSVEIGVALLHDVSADEILYPDDTTKIGLNISPSIVFVNYGDYDETFNAVTYIINHTTSDTVYADTMELTLQAGDTIVGAFAPWLVDGRNGDKFDIVSFTVLSGDYDARNDTVSSQTTLYSTGGSDGYGWNWYTSDDPQGPAYHWIELFGNAANADSVKALTPGDDGEVKIGLTGPFKFYGHQYDSVTVGSNGGLDFVRSDVYAYNRTLPTTSQYRFIAPFWEDLRCASNSTTNGDSTIYVGYFGDTLTVIEWYRVPRYSYSDEWFTFEVLLHTGGDNNDITFQYKDMSRYNNDHESATIGIQDSGATYENGAYVLYTYDESPFTPNWSEKGGYAIKFVNPEVATGVGEGHTPQIPRKFEFFNPFPNPAYDNVTIRMAIPKKTHVKVDVYDITGRKVATLMDRTVNPGYVNLKWNGEAGSGARVGAGIYFIKMKAKGYEKIHKVIFTR